MEYKYEEGDIVVFRKDGSIYKIVEVVQTINVISGNNETTYKIGNDKNEISFVPARDLDLLELF